MPSNFYLLEVEDRGKLFFFIFLFPLTLFSVIRPLADAMFTMTTPSNMLVTMTMTVDMVDISAADTGCYLDVDVRCHCVLGGVWMPYLYRVDHNPPSSTPLSQPAANATRWSNADLMLGHRLRGWPNIKSALNQPLSQPSTNKLPPCTKEYICSYRLYACTQSPPTYIQTHLDYRIRLQPCRWPDTHKALSQCCFNVRPTSDTVGQH